jgi:hypothetical protein
MIFDSNPIPASTVADIIEQAAARIGFSRSEMEDLLECELDTDHLLNYITAVVSDRMN